MTRHYTYRKVVTIVSIVITNRRRQIESRDDEINNDWITRDKRSRSTAFDVRTCETTHCCIQFLPQQFSFQLSFKHDH